MRMRHKKWSMPELLGSGYYVEFYRPVRGRLAETGAGSEVRRRASGRKPSRGASRCTWSLDAEKGCSPPR